MKPSLASSPLGGIALFSALVAPSCTGSATEAVFTPVKSQPLTRELGICREEVSEIHYCIQKVATNIHIESPAVSVATAELGEHILSLGSLLQQLVPQTPGNRIPRSELESPLQTFKSAAALYQLGSKFDGGSQFSLIDPLRNLEVQLTIHELALLEKSFYGRPASSSTANIAEQLFLSSLREPLVYDLATQTLGAEVRTQQLEKVNTRGQKIFGKEKWPVVTITYR